MKRPNILFFFTDDQRFNTINALGNPQISTPNIDTLVHEGTSFTRAYIMGGTNPAVCMPSRAMLMSGRYLFRLKGEGNTIPREHTTMPEMLRNAGYYTYHIGKWHQDRDSFHRSFDGADRIFGFTNGWYDQYGGHWNVAVHDYDPTGEYPPENGYILAQDKKTHLPIEAGVGGVHSSEMFADSAIKFLKTHKEVTQDKPFFMYFSFVAPHDPRQSPNKFEEMYTTENVDVPENFMPHHPFDNGELRVRDEALEAWPRREHAIKRHIAEYYAMISHIDEQIGRVIQTLKDTGEYENTLIIFAGDNGLALGQHGLMGKQNLYEHSIHVPLLFTGPNIPKDVTTDSMCYLLDIFPTLADYLQIPIPESVDGKSLVPAMQTPNLPVRDSHYFGYCSVQRAVSTQQYKLIEYAVNGTRTTQLFDLEADPWEMTNRATDPAYQERVSELRNKLTQWHHIAGETHEHESKFWETFNPHIL